MYTDEVRRDTDSSMVDSSAMPAAPRSIPAMGQLR